MVVHLRFVEATSIQSGVPIMAEPNNSLGYDVLINDSLTSISNDTDNSGFNMQIACNNQLADNPLYLILTIVTLSLAFTAVLLNLALIISLRNTISLPMNIRFTLVSSGIACMLLSLTLLAQGAYNVFAFVKAFPRMPLTACYSAQLVRAFATIVVCVSIAIGGIERYVATKRAMHGANQNTMSRRITLSILALIIFSLSINLVQQYANTEAQQRQALSTICYCDFFLAESHDMVIVKFAKVYTIVEIVTVLIYCGFWVFNRHKLKTRGMNTAQHSLSERMNILNHVTTTGTIMPTFILHGVCTVTGLVLALLGYSYTTNTVDEHVDEGVLILQGSNISFAIYSLLFPVLCFKSFENIRQSLLKLHLIGTVLDYLFSTSEEWKNRKQRKYATNANPNDPTGHHHPNRVTGENVFAINMENVCRGQPNEPVANGATVEDVLRHGGLDQTQTNQASTNPVEKIDVAATTQAQINMQGEQQMQTTVFHHRRRESGMSTTTATSTYGTTTQPSGTFIIVKPLINNKL